MADNELKVVDQKKYEEITKSGHQRTKTGEVIQPLFDYNSIDDYTKLAIRDIVQVLEDDKIDKKQSINIIKDKFQLEEVPEYNIEKSLWKSMMSEFNLGESIQGWKIVQDSEGKKLKIPVISFTGELDYLDDVMQKLITRIKHMVKK